MQEGGRHILRPRLAQTVGMTRERLWISRFHHRAILLLLLKVDILLDGIWTHRQYTLSHLFRFLLGQTTVSLILRLGIHRGSDPGAQARYLSPGTPQGHQLKGREKTLLLGSALRVTIIRPILLGKRTRMALLGATATTLHHRFRGCLLDLCLLRLYLLLAIMDIPPA